MDSTRGQSNSAGSSATSFDEASGSLSVTTRIKHRARTVDCRLLLTVDNMEEMSRNSLNWEDFFGSSLDLAPSLLNLFDRRLSSGGRDNSGDSLTADRTVTKTQSLPPKTDEDIEEVEYRKSRLPSQILPPDRPLSMMDTEPIIPRCAYVLADNKKRPLSISSVSSTSLTSSPRLRKKRASTFNGDISSVVRESNQDSSCTLVPEREADTRAYLALGSRHSVDSGCVDGYKAGDRYFDRMSVTSSETGSSKDETDSCVKDSSVKEYSVVPSLHSNRRNSSPIPRSTQGSDNQSSSTESRAIIGRTGNTTPPDICRSQSSSTNKQDKHISSPKHGSRSIGVSESRSLDNKLLRAEHDTRSTSSDSGRSNNASSRQEARVRFFNNYDEHLRQSSQLQAPIAEEIYDFSSSPQTQSSSESSPVLRLSGKSSSVSQPSSKSSPVSQSSSKTSSVSQSSNKSVSTSQSPSRSPSFPQSPNKVSSVPQSPNHSSPVLQASSKATPSVAISKEEYCPDDSVHHSSCENPPTSASPSSNTEHRRDHSSQLSPNSERASRKSDRHGSVSKHEPKSTSPRSGFSRTSKKRDPLNPSETGSKSTPVYITYVSRVVTEIIESERTYIASLEDIIHGYLEPMENILRSNDAKKDIQCLFSNIREIYQFGCTFLSDLERACADAVKVAQCFVKYNKGFVIYSDYCTNYPRAVEVLTRFMQHPELSQLCKERQLALGHGLPLGAYLLKPVQRILKYHLLLHNIVKNCEKEKEEAAILEQAFLHMTQMAHHINEMKRKHEHAVRIQEIQSQLEDYVGEDLTRLGELVLEGSFKVSGAKASRQVFLFEKGLLISKMKEGGMLSCKTFIRCSNLMLVEVIQNEPLSFHIIPFDNPRAQDTLQARNMEQKRRWCHDIKQLILESFNGHIPDNAKNLIMQLGRDHDDDYISKENLDAGRRNQHMAPEYLEKRRFRRKSGSRLPDFSILKSQKSKKGGNKKNEVKSGDKISAGKVQRSESRSPEVQRHTHSRQNFITKRRSQSTSSSTVSLPLSPCTYASDQSPANSNRAIIWPFSKTAEYSSPKSAYTSPDSPVSRKSLKKFSYSKKSMEELKIEAEINKRPVSFLMARTNPVLSEDVTELLARCGGTRKIQSPPLLEDEKEHTRYSLTDFPDRGEFSFTDRSDVEEVSSNKEPKETAETIRQVRCHTSAGSDPHLSEQNGTCICFSNSTENTIVSSETDISPSKSGLDERVKESRKRFYKSVSLPDLTQREEDLDERDMTTRDSKNKNDSHYAKSMYEKDNVTLIRNYLSRKGLKSNGQNSKQNDKIEDEGGNKNLKKENEVIAFQEKYRKSAGENVLLKKAGLRLPNTSKLLLAKECGPNLHADDIRSKLTNTGEKLTGESFGDLSLLDENSSIIDSTITSSRSSMDAESFSSSRPSLSVTSRSFDKSDVTETRQLFDNKENLEIMQRNRMSTLLYRRSVRMEKMETEKKLSSQIPYATPPREYMTFENMRRLGSLKDMDRCWCPYQDLSGSSFSKSASGIVNALGISPITVMVAKPVSFNTSNLLRSSSTPIPSESHDFASNNISRVRPVSMDMDKLTEESNRLVAEMEEYINNSSENMKSTNKFPTSIPAIPVEGDDVSSHRLSMVSSISTSSYESQCSSSSDGLVGTLKSKLRAWARIRNDSEYSYASTFTSDDEDQEEFTNSESGSALELRLKNQNSWKDNRELENVPVEHSLENSKSGLSLECHFKTLPQEQASCFRCADFSASQSHMYGKCDVDSVDLASEEYDTPVLKPDIQLEQVQFSHPSTVEIIQTLEPSAFRNDDIQHSHSDFLISNNESNNSDPSSLTNEVMAEAVTDSSEKSIKVPATHIKPLIETITSENESLDLKKNDSFKISDCKDSCCERKLSGEVESEISKENAENCDHTQQDDEEVPLQRKSIREYVHDFEEKSRAQAQQVLEVRRREPGVMIRQRLETLRDSASHNRPSSSHSSSRRSSEERDFLSSKSSPQTHHIINMPFTVKKSDLGDTIFKSICTQFMGTNDNLSKSVENLSKSVESLSKSQESVYLSRSRDSLTSVSDIPCNRHSVPVYSLKSNNPGHENDAIRFTYKAPETIPNLSGNQFIHRASTGSQQSVLIPETSSSTSTEVTIQPSRSACHLDELDTEDDSLVVMKGWVRALISKFQDKQ